MNVKFMEKELNGFKYKKNITINARKFWNIR